MIRVEIYHDCGKGLEFKRPSLVKSQFANECDLKMIVQRFVKTGQLPNLAVKQPLPIQDVTNAPDSFEAFKQKQIEANNIFEKQPLELREAMQHSPELFFEWLDLSDENKIKFLKEQGCSDNFIKSLIKQSDLLDHLEKRLDEAKKETQRMEAEVVASSVATPPVEASGT